MNKFYDKVEKLKEVGFVVQEEILSVLLLSSLPQSFEGFVIALETRDELPSLSMLKIKLHEEGQRRKVQENQVEKSEETVFRIRSTNEKEKSVNKRNGQREHKQAANGKRTVTCWNCGGSGHKASKCKAKKKSQESERANPKSYSVFCSVTQLDKLPKNMWFLNSGATAHLCTDRALFKNIREYKERILLAGNNYIEADGRGTVVLKWQNSD